MDYGRLTIAFSKEDRQKIRVLAARSKMSSSAWVMKTLYPYLNEQKDPPDNKKSSQSSNC